jgi:hypothetical protein
LEIYYQLRLFGLSILILLTHIKEIHLSNKHSISHNIVLQTDFNKSDEEVTTGTMDKIVDQGGPVLANAKVQLIFWGDWNDSSLDPSKDTIEAAIQKIINSEYYSKLSQYRGIQKPAYLGSVVNKKSHLPNTFKDSSIEKAIDDSIKNGSVPDFRSFTNGQIMYIVIPTPGHVSDNTKYDAFHYNFTYQGNDEGVYAVYSWRFKERELEWITRALAHEIAEACTNPVDDKEAFVDPNLDDPDKNEIADFCEKEVGKVKGVTVEGYWSNLDGGCVIPGRE